MARPTNRAALGSNITLLLLCLFWSASVIHGANNGDDNDEFKIELSSMSDSIRGMAAQSAVMNNPTSSSTRAVFPETNPHVCLAFLSCCQRTDLLIHTLAAAIRHMEEDEPDSLRYEIAWVDNGSGPDYTQHILDSHPIEHTLLLEDNTGLAFGMNLLIRNLCTAPYILLLEEDWLYMDELVATQTERRKSSIATAIAFTEQDHTAYDGRQVMGVFLRPETYGSFMDFPFMFPWQTTKVNLNNLISNDGDESCLDNHSNEDEEISYQIYCADSSLKSKYIWGSYTNGAGLYRRDSLLELGRMYGEPGDTFHDAYVEGNYAYRAGLKYCHAAIQSNCRDPSKPECTASFYHIGGGRGTRPMKAAQTTCASDLWNFLGTPIFDGYRSLMGKAAEEQLCSRAELTKLKELKTKDKAEYREEVKERNKQVFEKEQVERQGMRQQAQMLLDSDKDWIRDQLEWTASMTDDEIVETADRMRRLADSAHPLQGYWDSHGRPLQ